MGGLLNLLKGLNLYQEIESPGALAAFVMALKRSGKTAVAAGIGYGLCVLVGLLQADVASTHDKLLTLLFSMVSAQAMVAGISKFIKEHYGVTLPF